MTTTAKKSNPEELNFEEMTRQLDALLHGMESGELSLEDMLKKFEEGSALVKECRARLGNFAKKLEMLEKDDGENGQWSNFEPKLQDAVRSNDKSDVPF